VFAQRQSLSVTVRLGDLEEVEREESRDIGLRVFVGQQSATVSGSDISAEGRAKLIDRAVAMARLAPEDPYAALAPAERLARGPFRDLDLYDPTEPSAETLEAQARQAEAAARAVDKRDQFRRRLRLLERLDLAARHQRRLFRPAPGQRLRRLGLGHRRRGRGHGERRRGPLGAPRRRPALPDRIGRKAGERAVAKLNPRKIASTTAPVIFENRLAMSLLSPLIGAISGPSIARGTSFLKDKLGQQIFARGVTLLDDPFRPRGLGSAPFDDEGVACEPLP
jgi:PmbA protein